VISSACYVGTWEIVYFKLMPGFAEKYAAHMVERAKASGANQQRMEETERQAKQFKQMYSNPAINVALTFMEVFPIGLGSRCSRPGFSGRRCASLKNRRASAFAD
jgi:hypothetical protein